MGKTIKTDNGITLIALVITIIVLLILAGVTINLTLGQNGIFKTAEQAARNYKEAEQEELGAIGSFNNEISNIIAGIGNGGGVELPENTPTTPSGTQVKKPAGKIWDESKINSYADGIGNTIPVPVGFKPLTGEEQGTKLTGFVIVNEEDDNEFVWVPVEGMSYSYNRYALLASQPEDALDTTTQSMKIKYSSSSTTYFTEALPADERDSVATYGGYYIGRYEAGIEGGTLNSTSNSSITDAEAKKNWTGWTAEEGKEIKLVVKPGAKVWNYITRDKAREVAEGLYNKEEDNVTSKLCSSYAWDTALKFIETKYPTYPTNSTQGNYSDKSEALGKPADTGKTEAVNNIYDMGGNVYEWTTESCSNTSIPCTIRGGCYNRSSSGYPASSRYADSETRAYDDIALRATLFM